MITRFESHNIKVPGGRIWGLWILGEETSPTIVEKEGLDISGNLEESDIGWRRDQVSLDH